MTQEFAIVPKVATDEMISACRTQSAVNDLHNPNQSADDHQQEMYQTALEAAPLHNLVAIDKDELAEIKSTMDKLIFDLRHFGALADHNLGSRGNGYFEQFKEEALTTLAKSEQIVTKLASLLPTPPQGGVK